MDSSESEKLTEAAPSEKPEQPVPAGTINVEIVPADPICGIVKRPFRWIQRLCSELKPSVVFGIILVYGMSQGFTGAYFRVGSDYYWKDVQKVQPSVVQVYSGMYSIPWVLKPIWGLLTDVFPVRGYFRRPYFVLAGVLGTVSALVVSFRSGLVAAVALGCLVGVSAARSIADVTIDACIVRSSIEVRSLAPDLQTLCGAFDSVGSLVGYASSGFFIHLLGAQEALSLLAIPPALITVLGFVLYEKRGTCLQSKKKALRELGVALTEIYKTIKMARVWKPATYMFLSIALSISTSEGQFYWFTDPEAGPAFSRESVGLIYAIGALATLFGTLIYHRTLRDCPFRKVLLFAQLIYGLSGMLDVAFVLRWNLKLGIPDYLFVVLEEGIARIVLRIRWTIMMVLNTRLCPVGIEGTFFALLACLDSLGGIFSKWGGGIVLHIFHVSRNDFTNLWLVLLVRNFMRLLPLALISFIPNSDQSDVLVPSEPGLKKKSSTVNEEEADGLPLVLMNGEDGV